MDYSRDTTDSHHGSEAIYYIVFVLLMVLLGATVAASWVHLGEWNFPLAVLIASVKAALILLFFMHVRDSQPLVWVIACAGFFFLAILFGITFSD